jgi:hypothetical protein
VISKDTAAGVDGEYAMAGGCSNAERKMLGARPAGTDEGRMLSCALLDKHVLAEVSHGE